MGIKNFQARQKRPEKLTNKPILVSDYMIKKVISFSPEDSLLNVIDTLIRKHISGAPVLNNRGELVGIISEGDCIKKITESRYFNKPIGNSTIKNQMIKDVETISKNMNIFDAANQFLKSRRRRFPVIHDGRLVGLISQKDILKAILEINADKLIRKFDLSDLF